MELLELLHGLHEEELKLVSGLLGLRVYRVLGFRVLGF